MSISKKLAAEALGTGFLVATVVGSGIMAQTLTDDVALQLLANTIPTGAILVVLITVFGPISGARRLPSLYGTNIEPKLGRMVNAVPTRLRGAKAAWR